MICLLDQSSSRQETSFWFRLRLLAVHRWQRFITLEKNREATKLARESLCRLIYSWPFHPHSATLSAKTLLSLSLDRSQKIKLDQTWNVRIFSSVSASRPIQSSVNYHLFLSFILLIFFAFMFLILVAVYLRARSQALHALSLFALLGSAARENGWRTIPTRSRCSVSRSFAHRILFGILLRFSVCSWQVSCLSILCSFFSHLVNKKRMMM